jgi:hypothetical protein
MLTMRFRKLLQRGTASTTGEWQPMSLAYTLKRPHDLAAA